MKLKCCLIVLLVAVAFTCMPAFGQVDLTNGQAGQSEIQIGMYSDSAEGNQDTVREYDGRQFNLWGLELLNSYGYDGPSQYWFTARDLILGNDDIAFDLGYANELSLRLATQAMTHRFARIPEINPYLAPLGFSGFTDPATPFGDAFIDLTSDRSLGIDRRVNDFRTRLTPGVGNIALVGTWWQELENGSLQGMFYNGSRQSADFLIDRTTEEGTLGTDIKIGSGSAVSYRVENNEFSENAGTAVVSGTFLDNTKIPNIKTNSSVLKARSKLGDRLYFTGAQINRSRDNETTALVEHPDIDISSTNAGLTFLASDTLSLTGRYRNYKLDDNFEPLLNSSSQLTNYQHDRSERSLQLDASYTGVPRMQLRAGFEHRNTERKLNSDFEPGYEEYPLAVNESTDADIWSAGIRYNPTTRLSLSGRFEDWSITDPAYKGSPTDRRKMSVSATYLAADNLGIYGDFSKSEESNDIVHVPVADIPITATDTTEEEERLEAAGQGYNNDLTTGVIGLWYAVSP
ncbi:MAG: MtrB/PioB family outer membrane beta-barrel protein [Armatimonadota bacterium]